MMQQSLPQQPVTETKPDEKNLSWSLKGATIVLF
jgi:hypothetical protein